MTKAQHEKLVEVLTETHFFVMQDNFHSVKMSEDNVVITWKYYDGEYELHNGPKVPSWRCYYCKITPAGQYIEDEKGTKVV